MHNHHQHTKSVSNSYYLISEGRISIIVNLLLFVFKYWVGLVSGSLTLIADAWHTLSDSISSLVVLISGKIANKPADEEHPFGHGRIELIASIIIGVLLFMIGFEFIVEGVKKFGSEENAVFGNVAIIVTIASIIVKEANAQYALYGYRKTGYKALKADAWHHRSDAVSSVVILAGILLADYIPYVDSILAIIVALLIFKVGYDSIVGAVSPLLGNAPDEAFVKNINAICKKETGLVVYVHHVHQHEYGNHTELTFHIKLPGEMRLCDAHGVSDKIKKAVDNQLNCDTTIHIDPIKELNPVADDLDSEQ